MEKKQTNILIMAIIAVVVIVLVILLITNKSSINKDNIAGEAERTSIAKEAVGKETLTKLNSEKITIRGGKNTSQTCYDSDGNDPYTYGYVEVTYYYVNGTPSHTIGCYDGCDYATQHVFEKVCNGTEFGTIQHYCENGCMNGKCLNYTIPEPDVDMEIRAYKSQNLDNPDWDSVWARTNIEIDEYDGDGELDIWLNCYANEKYWSGGFNNWIWESEYEDTNSNGELDLYLESIEESDFSDLNCYGDLNYGPYSFDEQIADENIYFPNVDALMIAQEPNTGWQIYLIAHTLGEIETVSTNAWIEYDDGTEQGFDIWLNYPTGTTNIYEMIPINLSDNWTEISLYTSLRDSEPYVRTSARKQYEANEKGKQVQLRGNTYTLYEGTSIKLTQEEAIRQTAESEQKEKLKELASAN